MLAIDIIEKKNYITSKKTGEEILDLVTASWNTRHIRYRIKNIAIVTDETEMRPDLLALSYLGDTSYLGSMLKLNNISNPLSIKSGEVLVVPSIEMINDLFESGPVVSESQAKKVKSFRKELQEKISKVSKERLEYLNAKNISNLSQTPLPPNILQDGEQQISVEDGKLIFGPSIGQCRSKMNKNISVADIKTKLAQKNIFNK